MKRLLWLLAGATLLLLTACGGDETSQGNFAMMSGYSEQASQGNVAGQQMAAMQQAGAEPTGRDILDGVLTEQNTTISDLQKNVLAARLQQMINAGTDSNLQIALVLAANPQIRGAVSGSNVALSLASKVGEVKAGLANQIVAQPIESGSLQADQWWHRTITVPAGTSQLQVYLTVPRGMVDLLLKYGQQPDEQIYYADGEDCYDWANPDFGAQCVIDAPAPAPGTWHIALWAVNDSDFTVQTSLIGAGNGDEEPINPVEYQSGIPTPTTTGHISASQSAPAGSPANIMLDDSSQVEIPALLEGFDAQLERFSLSAADNVQSVLITLADTTDLTPTGAVRQLRVDGSGDGSSLQVALPFRRVN